MTKEENSVKNIAESFVQASKENAKKEAIINAKDGETITFAKLNCKADNYAKIFQSCGVKSGEIVSLMVTPSVDFICLTLALFKLGTPIVLIDPGMGYKNLLRCIERVAPHYLVGIPKACLFAKLFPKPFASLTKTFCVSKRGASFFGINICKKEQNISKKTQPPPSFPVYQPKATDLAAIIFTTGSTGPPKGVRYEHSTFAAQLRLIRDYYKIGATDVDQPAFPLFALFSTALGATAVIPDMDPTKPAQVDPKKFITSIKKYGVTYSFGSPAIWNVISHFCLKHNVTLPTVQKVLMAGAPVSYELLGRMQHILQNNAQIFTPYGATESLPTACIESKEIIRETFAKTKVGNGVCVGHPLPGIAIRIIAINDGLLHHIDDVKELPLYEIGEIIVKGDVVTRGYMNNEEETQMAKIYQEDGALWHRMGDTGYLDEKGRLWFCGRRAHRVVDNSKQNSEKTWFSIPCESIINEHPAIFRSALVGIKNNNGQTEPTIIVEKPKSWTKRNTAKENKLLDEVQTLATQSPLTADICHFLIHPDFPVDIRHNAKIFREKLAQWAQQKIYPKV